MDSRDKDVFLNCPFDDDYWPLLRSAVFTLLFVGYKPRLALDDTDSGETRLSRIQNLIETAPHSIHDLSRLRARAEKEFYRLNMAFELGMEVGARRFGSEKLRAKRTLVIGSERYDYQKALSDIAGCDIKYHKNDAFRLIKAIREWLQEGISSGRLPGPTSIWNRFNDFMLDLHDKGKNEGFSEDDLSELSMTDYTSFAEDWIRDNT